MKYIILEPLELMEEDCSGLVLDLFRDSIESSDEFKWQVGPEMKIRNSDGSLSDAPSMLRDGLVAKPDGRRIPCYEFNGRVVVHFDGSEKLLQFCRNKALVCNFNLRIE